MTLSYFHDPKISPNSDLSEEQEPTEELKDQPMVVKAEPRKSKTKRNACRTMEVRLQTVVNPQRTMCHQYQRRRDVSKRSPSSLRLDPMRLTHQLSQRGRQPEHSSWEMRCKRAKTTQVRRGIIRIIVGQRRRVIDKGFKSRIQKPIIIIGFEI